MAERDMVMMESLRQNSMEQVLGQEPMIYPSDDGVLSFISERLHPYTTFDIEYNDNIYQLNNDRVHDFIQKVNPGIRFLLGPKDLRTKEKDFLELDLGGRISWYDINHKANRSDPYGKINASLGRGKHRFDFKENYSIESLPVSQVSAGKQGTTDYIKDVTEVNWESVFHHIGFDSTYYRQNNTYIGDYKENSTMSMQKGSFAFFIIPEATPKTRFLFEYSYDKITYPKALTAFNNYYKNKYWCGVGGNITRKLSGTAKFGYETVKYYKTGKEYRNFPAYADLFFKATRRNMFIFTAMREIGTSNYVDEGNGDFLSLTFGDRIQLSSRIKFYGAFRYSKSKYGRGDEQFIYDYPLEFVYDFQKWLSGHIKYEYQFAKSDQDYYKYSNNVFSVGLSAEF